VAQCLFELLADALGYHIGNRHVFCSRRFGDQVSNVGCEFNFEMRRFQTAHVVFQPR
jgi:hypothetical protein